uniref:peroxidase n=2 Tax=Helianthus annuus TaxID=4232 RepID=A0A251RV85_HELAN
MGQPDPNLNITIGKKFFGSHYLRPLETFGQAPPLGRIYNSSLNIDAAFNSSLSERCPQTAPNGDSNLQPLDLMTPNRFDNNYFRNLVSSRGLLISDQVLFNGDSTDSIVTEYVNNPSTFDSDFAAAMIKMGEIDVLTGDNGIIRTRCTAAS